jgi:energy-coupling factor transporter ATP-binding protein EcfA2
LGWRQLSFDTCATNSLIAATLNPPSFEVEFSLEARVYIKKIEIENLKGFTNLSFDFERPDHTFAGWTVLVGGNASGKSTLLKAIALALVGPDVGRQLMSLPGWIGPGGNKAEAKAEIRWDKSCDAFRSGGGSPGASFDAGVRWSEQGHNRSSSGVITDFRAIEFRAKNGTKLLSANRGPWEPKARGWFSAGYGPMRRLSGSSTESIRFSAVGGALSRYVTLFREDASLSESETWLKLNHSRQIESNSVELEVLLEGVKALLGDGLLPHGMKISRITVDHVFVTDGRGVELPMRDISDGCRSIYATVLDLVHGMAEIYGSENLFDTQSDGRVIVHQPGVVLIDEIEAHLHPSWQRDIPEWLKIHFPKVQFIVSTHSPLVAQAADPNGVFVLPSQGDEGREPRRLDAHEYEMLKLARAEKTLLGTAFGLKTTRSKWAIDQIERWKRLNAKFQSGAQLTELEAGDFKELKGQMQIVFDRERDESGLAA